MSEYKGLIEARGSPDQIITLNYYLYQIEVQKAKRKEDIDKYRRKTDAAVVNKQKKLALYEAKLQRLREDNTLEREDFETEELYNEYLQANAYREANYRLSSSSRPVVECICLLRNEINSYKELRDKEIQRREDHYENQIRRFMIKLEALAKKVK